jgi:hypothetical protein
MLTSVGIYQVLSEKCRCPTHELISSGPLKNTNEEVGQLCINEHTVYEVVMLIHSFNFFRFECTWQILD